MEARFELNEGAKAQELDVYQFPSWMMVRLCLQLAHKQTLTA